uniref:Uncharacterized protein n=1 Tax=Mycena chlorophos TaxID=658473 RepID=A0ABQ0LRK9_MYCCL|nr:predicted protein [Mycena chlorophos]
MARETLLAPDHDGDANANDDLLPLSARLPSLGTSAPEPADESSAGLDVLCVLPSPRAVADRLVVVSRDIHSECAAPHVSLAKALARRRIVAATVRPSDGHDAFLRALPRATPVDGGVCVTMTLGRGRLRHHPLLFVSRLPCPRTAAPPVSCRRRLAARPSLRTAPPGREHTTSLQRWRELRRWSFRQWVWEYNPSLDATTLPRPGVHFPPASCSLPAAHAHIRLQLRRHKTQGAACPAPSSWSAAPLELWPTGDGAVFPRTDGRADNTIGDTPWMSPVAERSFFPECSVVSPGTACPWTIPLVGCLRTAFTATTSAAGAAQSTLCQYLRRRRRCSLHTLRRPLYFLPNICTALIFVPLHRLARLHLPSLCRRGNTYLYICEQYILLTTPYSRSTTYTGHKTKQK